jgi:hypothetical protein
MKAVLRILALILSPVFFYLASTLTMYPDTIVPFPENDLDLIAYGIMDALGIISSAFLGCACLIFAFVDE